MPSTTNFSWTTPADTDLVKDGALAIRTLGNGIDTSLVDLKGGTTGQALTKATNTDLDYSWTSIIPASESLFAAKNKILNSNFAIWQRGTSTTNFNGSGLFAADRWQIYSAAASGRTYSRQNSGLTGIQYCIRVARTSGNTLTNDMNFAQNLETANSISFAGQPITFSFYARKGADYSGTLTAQVYTGTGTDENGFYSGYTGGTYPISQTPTLTTSWQRFSYTATLATNVTEIAVIFRGSVSGTASTNDYYEITGVQLEAGSVATAFQTATGNPASELAACQRYYYRQSIQATPARFALGMANSTTSAIFIIHFPVQMRTAPTALEQSGTAGDYSVVSSGTTITNCSAVPSFGTASTNVGDVTFTVASGLTAGQALTARPVNTNAYLGWSAEL